MKEKLGNTLFVAGLLFILYLLINLVHLIWYIADPEGFWGFTYFLELLRVAVFIIVIAAFAVFLIILLVSSLIASFKNGFKKKEFIKGIGILVFLLTVPMLNYLWSNGPFLYITGTLANKYSHLETTEKYLNRGNVIKACEYAKNAYYKELNRGEISSFFLFTKWYSLSDLDKSQRLTSRYAAIIAYGLCIKETSGGEEEAEILFKEAVEISNSKLLREEKASFLSFPLMALAEIYLQRGEYYRAEEYFERLENFHEDLESADIKYQIQGRMFFADRAIRVGDFTKAAEIHLENVQLYEQNSSDENSQFYMALLLMATLTETYLENYQQVKELIEKAQPIASENEDALFYPNFLVAKANFLYRAALNDLDVVELINRSLWENILNRFKEEKTMQEQLLEEAEVLYKKAVEETAKKVGHNNHQYLSNLRQLGEFYYNTGRYEDAEDIFERIEELMRPVKDENPDAYNDIQLANLRTKENINYSLIEEVEDQIFRRISSNYLFLAEEEKESFIAKTEDQLQVINSIYVKENSSQANKRLYNNILATKQVALNSSSYVRNFFSEASEDLEQEYLELLKEKEKLLNSTSKETYRRVSSEIADKERKLYVRIGEQMTFSPFVPREVDWVEVKSFLSQDEVAIEIFSLPVGDNLEKKREDHYFALILKSDFEYPKLVPLFKEKELEKLLNKSGSTSERINAIYESGKEELLGLVWEPLLSQVHRSDAVYLSVDGILQSISFPALLFDQPGKLHILGSTRDISKVKASQPVKKKNLALFGDANFNSVENSGGTRSFSTVENQVIEGLEAGLFPALEYTRQEIDTIEKIFRPVAGSLLKLTGSDASEKSFRNLDNEYNIIHLATHGFYFKSNAAVLTRGLDLMKENYATDNPMYRSGLLLSGSGDLQKPKDNDGILTAFEISRMDLSAVDLMILSACETARGDISGSEGVFGLQRALKLAGVKDQIVSLWQVPDKQTAELFEIFYRQFSRGNTVHSSLNMAQTQMAQKYPPFYWAGFILLE